MTIPPNSCAKLPARIVAGDSLVLRVSAASWPSADGWAVSLTMQPIAGGFAKTTVAGAEDAGDWVLTLTAALSAALVPGAHRFLIAAARAGERQSIGFGETKVLPNPETSAADQRSAARRALDVIDAVLEQRAGSAEMKFEFEDGRSVESMPHGELLKLRAHYARIVVRERQGRRGPARVNVRL